MVLIVQRLAQLIDEIVDIRFLHEGIRPKQIVQFLLRDRFRMTLDQHLQKLQRLRLQMHELVAAPQLATIAVKDEVVKANAHSQNSSCRARIAELDCARR